MIFQKEFLFERRIRSEVKQSAVRAVQKRQMMIDFLSLRDLLTLPHLILFTEKPSVLMLRPYCIRASDTKWRLIEMYYQTSYRPIS